jgi:hypothetical protein
VNDVQRPNIDRMWETFIKIPNENNIIRFDALFNTIRCKVSEIITQLKNEGSINWYCFLIHNQSSGVPTTQDDKNPYFHIRMALDENYKHGFPNLPEYCLMTRKIKRKWVENISITQELVFDVSLFKHESIEEVWRIIGEQSEWLLRTFDAYKENVIIPPIHIIEFLHYYSNMTQMRLG